MRRSGSLTPHRGRPLPVKARPYAAGSAAKQVPAGPAALNYALTELAAASETRLRAEEAAYGALDPWPLPVRWATTMRARRVMVGWAAVRGTPESDAPVRMSGR